MNLLPDQSEHDVRVRFFVDPASVAMVGTLILLLMVVYFKVLKKA